MPLCPRPHLHLFTTDTLWQITGRLWPRIEPLVSGFRPRFNYQPWRARGINPCFRSLRYAEGQVFETHTDDVYSELSRRPAQRSFLTVSGAWRGRALSRRTPGQVGGQYCCVQLRSGSAVLTFAVH